MVLQEVRFFPTIEEEAGLNWHNTEVVLKIEGLEEASLERMEALLSQSAMGVHVLFENQKIAEILKESTDDKDFYSFEKMKKVQDVMTELIAKRSYIDKMAYLQALDKDSYQILVRAYFHIVENTVRANNEHKH